MIPAVHSCTGVLQALQTLFDVALGPEGLILGPSWWLVLRCMSVLEAMVENTHRARIAHRSAASPSSPRTPRSPALVSDVEDPLRMSGATADAISASLAPVEERVKSALALLSSWMPGLAPEGHTATSMQRSHDALFSPSPHKAPSPAAAAQSPRTEAAAAHARRSWPHAGSFRRDEPGAGLRRWAYSNDGAEAMDAVFARSAALDGQNVVLFFRALCAVSNQELQPLAGAAPRVSSLRRLTESLFMNVDRIRLVWGRVWAVVSPHYVSAACSEHPDVAMVALDSLKQLASHLLQRSELALFNWQQHALEPFVQTLRHAGDPSIRCMALGCLLHFLKARSASCWPCTARRVHVTRAAAWPVQMRHACVSRHTPW
jgi:Domain of unknown function (DUF1981)